MVPGSTIYDRVSSSKEVAGKSIYATDVCLLNMLFPPGIDALLLRKVGTARNLAPNGQAMGCSGLCELGKSCVLSEKEGIV